MKLRSPSKVNLFLKVVRRRPDGFHEIETVFERLALFDTITLSPAKSGIRLVTSSKDVPNDHSNLAWRAAQLLRERYGVKRGVTIRLQKRVPVSAGLGGGSANAATVLAGLNKLWDLRLPQKTLLTLGASLGSDVPFFLLDTSFALGRGRGEKLTPLKASRRLRLWHCVVKPPFGVSTAQAYAEAGKLLREKPSSLTPQNTDVRMLFHSILKGRSDALSNLLFNSLEVALNKRVRSILNIKKELLREGASSALLSGSGSSVFGIFRSAPQARRAARVLGRRHRNWKVFAVPTY